MTERPVGRRFSQVYAAKGAPSADSVRFRRRLCTYISGSDVFTGLAKAIQLELGINVPFGTYTVDWVRYFEQVEVGDLLDTITLAARVVIGPQYQAVRDSFRIFVERALREENLHYTLDEKCGVHPYVDEAFQLSRVSAIVSLADHGHAAALASYQAGMDALVSDDTLTAVRCVFDAAESLFKQEFSVSRLGKAEIDKHFVPRLKAFYSDRASDAGGRLAVSFGEWVNGAHQYRHADGSPEPTPPPRELAVAFIQSGTAWIRWMTDTNFLKASDG